MELFVQFDIGTPGKTMNILCDSGSDWFWINSIDCQDCGGKRANRFDPSQSSTAEIATGWFKNVTLMFGSGDAKGVQMEDRVCLTQSATCKSYFNGETASVDHAD